MKRPSRESGKRRRKHVKEIARKKPGPLRAESSVEDAGEKMRLLHAKRLPVVSGDRLVGELEGAHPERKAGGMGHDPEATLVRDLMARKVHYCFENQTLDEAAQIMREHHLEYLPVVDDSMRVIGLLARRDLEVSERPAPK